MHGNQLNIGVYEKFILKKMNKRKEKEIKLMKLSYSECLPDLALL